MGEGERGRKKKDTKLEEEGRKIQEIDELKRKKGGRRENENKQRQRVEKISNFKALISYVMFVQIILCAFIFINNDRIQRRL